MRGVVGLGSIGAILFGVAGRIDWPAAWVFISLFGVYLLVAGWWFLHHDAELLQERMTIGPNVPHWDRILGLIYRTLLPILFATAALDAGRFEWSRMPVVMHAIGVISTVVACSVIWWCTATNHFLSSHARIQSDRGHRVARDGPYRYVRHPMYTALIVLMIGMSLLLGSWLAVVPAILIGILIVVRTSLEDRMLKTELDGYREYANHVRQRLLPGLW